LDGFESGKEQADQNRNDRDDDEQLDERERAMACCGGAHGANPNRKLRRTHVKYFQRLEVKE